MSWDRQRLLDQLWEVIEQHPKIDRYYGVALDVFSVVEPFGANFLAYREPNEWLHVSGCWSGHVAPT